MSKSCHIVLKMLELGLDHFFLKYAFEIFTVFSFFSLRKNLEVENEKPPKSNQK